MNHYFRSTSGPQGSLPITTVPAKLDYSKKMARITIPGQPRGLPKTTMGPHENCHQRKAINSGLKVACILTKDSSCNSKLLYNLLVVH